MKLLRFAVVACLGAVCLFAADVTGKWGGDMEGRDGNAIHTTMNLKAEGNSLTGTVSGMRGGDTAISDGHVDGDSVTFSVVREFNGNQFKMNYKGKVNGDSIHFTVTREGGEGQSREFDVKRSS